MKKIFRKLFSKNRINLIQKYLSVKNPIILEIGIHKGDFSKKLFEKLKPKKLILVDPWIAYNDLIYQKSWYGNTNNSNQKIQDQYFLDVNKRFEKDRLENKIEIFRKTSDEFFLENKNIFDLIYIDGNHLFEFVKKDIENSLKFINVDGLIVLDDYGLKGWWSDGITKAVKYYEKEKTIRIISRHNIFNYHHQCIIKKI
ncbi:class I SAM-dependent methyltransferase [Candidatus Pelagibacter sp. HIMB1485]|uniref:class I SAM-dependent methyltransferase n=1 Tax=Candidatus Pelagibacter sp. HIMB1485 TaxID=3415415 RepID=UPI003F866F21